MILEKMIYYKFTFGIMSEVSQIIFKVLLLSFAVKTDAGKLVSIDPLNKPCKTCSLTALMQFADACEW